MIGYIQGMQASSENRVNCFVRSTFLIFSDVLWVRLKNSGSRFLHAKSNNKKCYLKIQFGLGNKRGDHGLGLSILYNLLV